METYTNYSSLPHWLTQIDQKRQAFADDTYFVETWQDALSMLGRGTHSYCIRHSTLLVKPEALRLGKVPQILRWLHAHDWQVVHFETVRASRHVLRGLWRYQWNAVTRQHKQVVDMLFGTSDCLFLLLRSTTPRNMTATQKLAEQKGPSEPDERAPWQLRATLGNYNAYLNFVHSPDEPADLIRELGVLFGEDERREILNDNLPEASEAHVLSTAAAINSHTGQDHSELSLEAAARRLTELCKQNGTHKTIEAAVTAAIESFERGEWHGDWRDIHRTLETINPGIAQDFAFTVLATYLTNPRLDGVHSTLPTIRGMIS